ncbi:MAG: hypothetical protein J2P31_08605 [Blastocatellia bacterium]|nr:hypothetical protein [Blastocatellia bacterium]
MNKYSKRTSYFLFIWAMMSILAVSALAQDKDDKKDEHQGRQHDHGSQVEKSAADKSQDSQAGDKQFLGKGDGIETCPVTGEPVDKDIKVEINGRVVYACCPGCLDSIKENPELYLKKDSGVKIEEKQEENKPEGKFLGKGDGIETCPVTGEPVDKDIKAEINGRVVYACCPGCLDTIKENPDLYLKKTDNKADKK